MLFHFIFDVLKQFCPLGNLGTGRWFGVWWRSKDEFYCYKFGGEIGNDGLSVPVSYRYMIVSIIW